MAWSKCIYTGVDLLDNVPKHHERARSFEHIIPLSLGGVNQLTTWDVCSKANGECGSWIDAPFADHPLTQMKRQMLGLTGHSKTVPTVTLDVAPDAGNRSGRATIPPDGDLTATFPPEVSGKVGEAFTTGQPLTINAQEEAFRKIAEGQLKAAKAQGLELRTMTGETLESVEAMMAAGTRLEQTTLHSRINVDDFLLLLERFALKVSLGYAHFVLDGDYSESNDAANLRAALWTPPARWSAAGLVGSAGADPNSPATINQTPSSIHYLELGTDQNGVWIRGALFGTGPFQWLLRISDNPMLARALNGKPAIATIDIGAGTFAFEK